MDQQVATDFVIQELGKTSPKKRYYSKALRNSWNELGEAEKFLRRVEVENKSAIALKQSPLITSIGVGSIILGLGLTLWIAIETIQGYVIFFLSFPVPYLGNIFYFFMGLAMTIGGIWGMWDTVVRIWNS